MAELVSIRPELDDNLICLINEMVSIPSTKRPQTMQEIVDRLTPYTATADLASLVTEYFRWNSKKSPAVESVIAPPITVSTEKATRALVSPIESKTSANKNGMPVEPVRKSHWFWTAGIAATVFSIAFGYWFWPADESGKNPPVTIVPPQITTGDLELVPEGEIAVKLLSDGAVFATNRNTGETSTVMNGINAMEPGTYSIFVEGPEDFKPLDEIQIVKGAKRKQSLTTSLTKQFAFPTIPEEAEASATYKGTLSHAGWPDKKEVPFQMRLHVLSIEERAGSPKFAWLKMDTTTHHAEGDYSETGYLKINVDRWKSENFLEVADGFVRARGDAISQLAQDRASGSNRDGLVVPFLKERDWLREIASDALPEHRLSLHDFIALFFGDASVRAATESIRELRPRLLISGQRNAWLESFNDSFGGGVSCYVASSRTREADRQTPGYSMARRKAEPFGFVSMEAKIPSLKATCAITTSSPAKVDMSELEWTKKECINPEDWSSRNQFWSLAGLPSKEGETTWQGSIEITGSPRQIVRATARALGTESSNNRTFRWIEIEVSSTLENGENEHWESARLLVDENEYRDFGKFEAKNGWLSFGDKKTVFALPENRDLTEIIKERMMLFESPNFRRFSVIDAMAMLFDAEFIPQSMMSVLRKEIFVDRVGLNPKRTSVSIPFGSTPTVQGELWESPKGVPFEYKIYRTSNVLFNFVSVSLERSPLAKIALAIKNPGPQNHSKQPSAMNPMTLIQWQAETQRRVKEAIKPNWRVWTWNHSEMKFMAWAEFGGTLGAGKIDDRSKRDILLRARNGKEIRVPCNALSDDDWNWARKGREWNAMSLDKQYNLVDVLGEKIHRQQGEGKMHEHDFESLTDDEKSWIKLLRSAIKEKYNPNVQIPEWLDFAPYIRK